MIVACDASFVIALRARGDVHADRARRVALGNDNLLIHPVTLAETLVVPARQGIAREVRTALTTSLGIRVWTPDPDEPERVAELRARTNLKLPDCYVLELAMTSGACLLSFDAALTSAAKSLSISLYDE